MTPGSIETSPVISRQLQVMAPKIITIVLLLIVAWLLARLTWEIVQVWQAPENTEVISFDGESGQQNSVASDWQNMPLFGRSVTQQSTTSEPARPRVPKGLLARMRLEVLGIVDSNNPGKSYVVIREKGETMVLQEGDEIRDGITIETIEPKSFIATDGTGEKRFEIEMLSEGSDIISTDEITPDSGEATSELPPVDFRVTNAQVLGKIEEYKTALADNPLELIGQIRVQPVPRDGVTYGYRVYPGRDRTLLTGVGLRPGDILISVNDNPLSDPAELNTILDSLSQSSTIQLKIERGGKIRDINVVLEN
ncbi:MAG: type II secretion system protein GspC [Chromatiales bacterium]|jgi:general secretion pathway protein C